MASKKFFLFLLVIFFITVGANQVSAAPVIYSGNYPNGLVVKENGAIVEDADISDANGTGVCLQITGDNVTVRNSKIHDCQDHGVRFLGTNGGVIESSEIYRAAMRYTPNTVSSSWPSLLKVQSVDETATGLSQNIIIRNNYIHEGYGECMGLRGSHITVTGNTVKDCYSMGIYSNSDHTLVEKNFAQCTGNPEFNRDGYPMVGIGFAEETFSNWGAHGHDSQTVINNIVVGCKYGVRYGSSTNGQGLSDSTIAFNTLYKITNAPISIMYYSSQKNLLIENNIASAVSANASGATIIGNVPYTFSKFSTPSDFALTAPLPASGSLTVNDDFMSKTRVAPLDAGAMEYGGATPSTPAASAVKAGDANLDGKVDEVDYGIWLSHFGQTVTGGASVGDFDGNGKVDGIDYTMWLTNYGT